MSQQKPTSDDLTGFVRRATKQRLDYLKLIKSIGYAVDSAEIIKLENELRGKDAKPKASVSDVINSDDLGELQRQLALVDLIHDGNSESIKLLLLRLRDIAIRMRPDSNHRRAHFHIEYRKEYSASYAVDTLEKLAGQMPARYEKPVLEWAAEHKQSLTATWNKLKAGEDVQEMIFVGGES